MVNSNNLLTNLKKSLFIVLLLCAVALSAISQPAYAQINGFKITASDAAAFDEFGESVSISGDYAVVGTPFDDDNGTNSGSAYIFKRTGESWTQEAKLLPSDAATDDFFGFSVSISGDYAVVGGQGDDDNGSGSGSAYVFKRTGTSWAQEDKLLPSDGAASDFFGNSVSISGDYAVVGAFADDDNGSNSGSAYVFKRTGTSWAQEDKLLPSDGATGDEFGKSVSISGDYAVVGALKDDDNGSASGAAYVYKRAGTTWTQEAKLLPSDGAGADEFGVSVSISGDYAVVGSRNDDDNGSSSGSAYLFKRTDTTWAQEAKLLPADGAAGDRFGVSVAISGDMAVVGAEADNDYSGSAYLFKRTGTSWAQEAKLFVSDGAADDNFGVSVTISGGYTIVGAAGDDDYSGSAYLYNLHDPFVVNPIQDVALAEDFGTVIAALLDTVFNDLDLPNDSLIYAVSVSSGLVSATIAGDTLRLFSVDFLTGTAEVVVTATDDSSSSVSDTFNVTVLPDTIRPNLSFSPDTLDFSTVFIGFPASKQLIVTNSGVDSLFISDISSDNGVFTIDVTSSELGAGGHDTLTVTFSPVVAGSFSGELTFASNDFRDSSKTVHLTGNSFIAPVISVTPDSIDEVLVVGDSASHVVTINNSGGSDLIWEAFTFQSGGSFVLNSSPKFTNRGEKVRSKDDDKQISKRSPRNKIYRSDNTADKLSKVTEENSSGADERSLEFILDRLNLNFESVTDLIPNKFDFEMDGETGYDIDDGGDDMYDGGNILNTDLGGPILYSDNVVLSGSEFGAGGRYFTRYNPGLFVLAADMNGVSEFVIDGNLGADGYGSADGAILQIEKGGITYNGFLKRVTDDGEGPDPSINHLVIVEQLPDVGHEFSFDTNNDYHRVFNLEANRRLYYLLYAGSEGSFINNETTLRIMDAFLEAIDPLPWIRLTPESGIVAAGASTTMEVFLDGRLLRPADYRGNIGIRSNDPVPTDNTVSVRFKVLPPPIDPPEIVSIVDVPEDQGGWVTLSWRASKDDDFFSDTPVSFYSIWLRNNSPDGAMFEENEVLLRRVEKRGSDVMTAVTKQLNVGEENLENADVQTQVLS
ncbi:MAG: choice-of-anchor D domain-containing protein, partial [Candidatus Marinimicrobia bacterium]|nr:choice-of-anchor D domain-containing protein [Candidatus Neomarinimicrobiota bacterium]